VNTPGYTIDLEQAVQAINKHGYKRIALQLPEGLKIHMRTFVDFLEKETGATVMVDADPCFGACDVANYEFRNLDVEFVIQLGHTPMSDVENFWIPTLFLTAQADLDVSSAVEKALLAIKGKKIGLVTTAQHLHDLDNVKDILVNNELEPVIGEGDDRIAVNGQILGCNFSAALSIADKVDSFLFIGSGMFHPLGLLLAVKKPVVAIDPYTNEVKAEELDELKDMTLRQRYGAIARSKDAKVFGILVGIKRGQQRIELAYRIKDMLVSKGKKAYVISLDNFSPAHLESFTDIDCFVSTACPRIAIDDYMQYKTPIITPIELEIVLGKRKWEDYQFDQIMNQ
jgi:2-(3-amino-3-carboxypropyl)histidine synthase